MSNPLSSGDTIEYSLSTNVQVGARKEVWVRVAATTTIRSGEGPVSAKKRLAAFVERMLDQKVTELTS